MKDEGMTQKLLYKCDTWHNVLVKYIVKWHLSQNVYELVDGVMVQSWTFSF